jgi:anti-sigma factor RsiW
MLCPETMRLHAYFDGEIDPVGAVELEQHLQGCAACRSQFEELQQLRSAFRASLPYFAVPPALRERVLRALDEEPGPNATAARRRPWPAGIRKGFWLGAGAGLGTAALAAALAVVFLMPPSAAKLEKELLSAHVSSLMSSHLVDVVSTDQHTVKPWFAGHTDVSPLVADFETQGYKLVGGRVDYLDHQRAAVVIYQHGPHVINVFSWAADSRLLPERLTRNGYHMAFWKIGDLEYCAISDTAWTELLGLERLLAEAGAHDGP